MLLEEVLRRENLLRAYQRVKRNGGAPGVDGMTVEQLGAYLVRRWEAIREELLAGRYRPALVRSVEIPKPSGGVRRLGIPTVLDRLIQQALLQVLQPHFDATFSERSFGFRPGRSAHQAVMAARAEIAAGYRWVVDVDLKDFFDRVNHDVLMARLARRVKDKRILRLIRLYLQAGLLQGGLVSQRVEGTPQGGPLSPLLSNVLLDELDRELQRRGHRFVRYADDCNVYVRSRRAGERVLDSLERFLAKRLRLEVNRSKSAVDRPWRRKFLGYSVTSQREARLRVSPESVRRLKEKLRLLLRSGRGRSLGKFIHQLGPVLTGLMLAGRIGSGIAAELGSMVVTDQINALRALGTDPVRKLVVPRVLAGFFMAPVLTVIADTVGILGGFLIAFFELRVSASLYWSSIIDVLYMEDIIMGLAKPFCLGYVIVTIGCHVGLRTHGGTQGVGRSTTAAVVAASVAVIAVDFFVTRLLITLLY